LIEAYVVGHGGMRMMFLFYRFKKIVCLTFCFMLPVVCARGQDATAFYELGLKSTITRTKIRYFTKALELDFNLGEAYRARGMLYFYQEKFNQAIQDFDAFIRLVPTNAEAHRMLAMAYLKSGFYEPAIAEFSCAITLDPELAAAYAYRAEAYRCEHKYEEAVHDASVSINMTLDGRVRSDALRTRAKVFRTIGRNESAIADVQAAWDIDPRIPSWWRYFLKGASPEEMKFFSPFLMAGIAAVLVFGIKLKPPDKDG
jgi:tetratricopeptide (TPR) repeat protein